MHTAITTVAVLFIAADAVVDWQRSDAVMHAVLLQVDAMKVSVKEFKKEYKKINIDNIEVIN